jgi:hypothetical protein
MLDELGFLGDDGAGALDDAAAVEGLLGELDFLGEPDTNALAGEGAPPPAGAGPELQAAADEVRTPSSEVRTFSSRNLGRPYTIFVTGGSVASTRPLRPARPRTARAHVRPRRQGCTPEAARVPQESPMVAKLRERRDSVQTPPRSAGGAPPGAAQVRLNCARPPWASAQLSPIITSTSSPAPLTMRASLWAVRVVMAVVGTARAEDVHGGDPARSPRLGNTISRGL